MANSQKREGDDPYRMLRRNPYMFSTSEQLRVQQPGERKWKLNLKLPQQPSHCAALPEGTVETLLKPENKAQLTDILLYHVDDRKLSSDIFPTGTTSFKPILTTERLCITSGSSGVTIADGSGQVANVVVADIMADNGVIHVVDKVLMPGNNPSCK